MKKILCILLISSHIFAQEPTIISEAEAMQQESQQMEQEGTETAEVNPQQKFEENPTHNKHEYNYKQQVIVGGAVMFCVALAMVINNNYNPKRGN